MEGQQPALVADLLSSLDVVEHLSKIKRGREKKL
jgi:hypothetical protein